MDNIMRPVKKRELKDGAIRILLNIYINTKYYILK
jgi:hypothetical protein